MAKGSIMRCVTLTVLVCGSSILDTGAYAFQVTALQAPGRDLRPRPPLSSLRGGFGIPGLGGKGKSDGLSLRNGGEKSPVKSTAGGVTTQSGGFRDKIELGVLIFLWYATSVVCTNSTKGLGLHWSIVTLSQLVISSLCGFVGIRLFGIVPYKPIANADQLKQTSLLAAVFTMGFITLNSALGMMHVSLVMTLRATEPIFTLLLSVFLLKSEQVTFKMAMSLMPVVFGAALSSAESADFRIAGLIISVVCNIMFALRGILTKRLKASHTVDNFNLFFQVCFLGALFQGACLAVSSLFVPVSLPLHRLSDISYASTLLVNGVSFYAYLQLSWVVLSRIAAVSHSVCNSLRRPVMCVFGSLQFGNPISPLNSAGIAMATLGTLLYSQVRLADGKSAE
uniref:Sugar phosphate transporter domain-containing protein n=1 Tax=Hemiselmis andersenii TaxID=464988 RepID=A0A6U4TXC1_HEMAN|mmetsp:Transcript_19189/g.46115  ORF Transcript_19189/g.46115 Transcript_19189/m.46115 type:complete len:395 (+) Transcript_19189:149-1333(+)